MGILLISAVLGAHARLAPGFVASRDAPRRAKNMLAFERQSAFETWLAQCPLEHAFPSTYSVERKVDQLTISCSWTVAPQTGRQVASAANGAGLGRPAEDPSGSDMPHQAAAEPTAAELAANISKLKALVPPEAMTAFMSGTMSLGRCSSREAGASGAALAAMLAQRCASGPPDTSAASVRETLSMIGMMMPKPPGRSIDS